MVNYAQAPAPGLQCEVRIARWDLHGDIETWRLAGMSRFDSIHDIKASRDYLVICDLPFVVEPQSFLGEPRCRPAQSFTQMWIVRKADLDRTPRGGTVPVREIRIPMPTGHPSVDYESDSGNLVIYLQHIPTADLAISIGPGGLDHHRGMMMDPNFQGFVRMGLQPTVYGRYVIDPLTGQIKQEKIFSDAERCWGGILYTQNLDRAASIEHNENFWISTMGWDPDLVPERLWDLVKDVPHPIVPLAKLPSGYRPGELVRVDLNSMSAVGRFTFPDGQIAHPPTFVPRRNPRDDADGYIVIVVHKNAPKEVQIFDAKNLARGPVARATAPDFNPPLLLHSIYMRPRRNGRPSNYRVDLLRDVAGALRGLSPSRLRPLAELVRVAAKATAMSR